MTHAAESLRQVIEAALLKTAEPGCSCEPGGPVCPACAAIEALEQLAMADVVAGLLDGGNDEGEERHDD